MWLQGAGRIGEPQEDGMNGRASQRRKVLAAGLLLAVLGAWAWLHRGVRPAESAGGLVRLQYVVEADGREIFSTSDSGPVEARLGSGALLPGLDDRLAGLRKGEKRTIVVAPERGYGLRDEREVRDVPVESLRDLSPDLQPGDTVHGLRGGRFVSGRVVSIRGGRALLDFNHPLAGKTLIFRVTGV